MIVKKSCATPLLLTAILALSQVWTSPPASAEITVHIGPPSTGGGGPNPLSIPPVNILDYELVWLTKAKSELTFGIFPGLFYGRRITARDVYASLGGGLVINQHGVGPGVYSAFGYQRCWSVCFNAEYKQALGYSARRILSPYAIRIGLTFFPHS